MINKKPFRVTNEQVKALTDCNVITCDDTCPACFICTVNTPANRWPELIRALSSDLKDARELIDKQEALIKEMRNVLVSISQMPIAYVCETVRIKSREQWEKTKDYV